ncbi:hypothetical protein [Polyangium sp. y55x31]|uniref:hypothetical protein n=1 Tax=Polyangium sp. y55x31 TaxID=3042688 RepID=UPI00248310C7|nr:hypothetical protein [Polyangium sp. y55x31]MDI1478063.1 hypothetical protein [Polyangium sp. y55x31]
MSASDRRTESSRTSSSADTADPERRSFLAATLSALASALVGCGGSPAPVTKTAEPTEPPLSVPSLDGLLPLAGLRWLVLANPREITSIPWLVPFVGTVIPEARFNRFAQGTAVDLRQTPEAIVASYATNEGDATVELLRLASDVRVVERAFRDRLSTEATRAVDRHDLVRVSGKIGRSAHAFAAIGPDVVCFQQAGSIQRGPCRIATLFARGALSRAARAFSDASLRALAERLGPAPARAFALGPFEGELARGARGLLAAATAIGAAARPSAREGILLSIAVAGDFSRTGEAASEELVASWKDLAEGSFGHLLGLDVPVMAPLPTHAPDAVAIAVELDPRKLAKGLADATSNEIDQIMR